MDGLIQDIFILDDHQQPKFSSSLMRILFCCVTTLFWLFISLTCLPLFVMGLFIWGMPPMIPTWPSYSRYFIAAFTEGKPEENIPITNRVLVFLMVLGSLIKIPIHGVCWYIDELIYSSYHKVKIKKPVFMVTAPRSGSSQLQNYLQDDTMNFIAPTLAEGIIPYIWVWKLFTSVLIKLGLQDYFYNTSLFGTEATKRHHVAILESETWDGILRSWYFGLCNFCLGSSFMCWGYSFARLRQPMNEDIIRSFMMFTDCVMKKVMYYRGKPKQRMLLKGHFVVNARNIERKYPHAKFLAVVRNPVDRLSSFVNLMKLVAEDTKTNNGLFPATWRVIRDYVVHTQVPYCIQEMSFYKEPADNKLVIPFTMYVNNLSATLQRIYSFCDIPISDDVISNAVRIQHTTHDYTRRRASYDPKFNKSLASLGVEEEKLKDYLNEYIEWMNKVENNN